MKKLFTHVFFAMALCLLSINSYAQDGSNDATFNPNGTGADGTVYATAIQSDGKILIGGEFTSYNGTTKNNIARLNTDGSLDAGFTGTGANGGVYAIAIQSDGKILIGGYTGYNGPTKNNIVRLNSDGTLDATFNPSGTGANNVVNAIALQSDGKILIGGGFSSYNGTTRNYIARLNTNGTVDANFNSVPINDKVYAIALQSDGKILIGGWFNNYNGSTKNKIARLNTDGTLDAGFTTGTGANNNVYEIALQSDGKILIGGDFTSYNGTTKNRIARLNTNGTVDVDFTGTGANGRVNTMVTQSDEKILIGGFFTSYNGTTRNGLTRLNTDGSVDAGFTGTGVNGGVTAIELQSDGKILIGGGFTSYDGVTRNRVARINNSSITGIDDTVKQDATGLSVFPNPSTEAITIQLNKEETFNLYNSLGQIVRTIQLNQTTGNSATITGLEPGVYFLTGQSNTLLNYKIIVE